MYVVVVGCGRVGSELAMELDNRGHEVVVIDRVEAAFRRLPEAFRGQCVVGIGFDRDVLRHAGIERADSVAAVTNGDNSNIVIARVARENFQVEHVVARIYDPRRAQIYQRLGIPTVATSQWTIEQVLRQVVPTVHALEWSDSAAQISLIQHTVAAGLGGMRFSKLDVDGLARVIAVTRLGQSQLARPDLVCQEGDSLYFAAVTARLDDVDAHLTDLTRQCR